MAYIGQAPTKVPLTSADITDGSISNVDIADLAASKLTGSIADARVPESAVTQHVAATDLTPVRQDIAMLALHSATVDNKAAYNLPYSFIDHFQDETGITTKTQCDVRTGEHVSTIAPASTWSSASPTWTTISNFTQGWGGSSTAHTNLTDGSSATVASGTSSATTGGGLYVDLGASYSLNSGYINFGSARSNGDPTQWTVFVSTSTPWGSTGWDFSGVSSSTVSNTGSVSTMTSATSGGVINLSGHSGNGHNSIIKLSSVPTVTARYITIKITGATFHDANAFLSEFDIGTYAGGTSYATGTLISDTQTAPAATTKMSGVILYKDNAGTATLGTDLVISLSANNGGNWTDVTSSSQYIIMTPVFSTGVKMAVIKEQTVSSGTAPVMKAGWANQAASSKETELHGWAMNY